MPTGLLPSTEEGLLALSSITGLLPITEGDIRIDTVCSLDPLL